MSGSIRRRLAAFGAVGLIGAGAFVATAPAAGAVDLGGGVVTGMEIDGNKTVEGAAPAFDWNTIQATGTTPGYVIDAGAGIVSAGVVQSHYTIDSATNDIAASCGTAGDPTTISGKVSDNPWNLTGPDPNKKDDICSGGNALEPVDVNGQVHYVLYEYYTRSPDATGSQSVLFTLNGSDAGRCDDVIFNVEFSPSAPTTFQLMTWTPTAADNCANPSGPGQWSFNTPTAAQQAAFEGFAGRNLELGTAPAQVQPSTFGEIAIDLSAFPMPGGDTLVPQDRCVSFTTGDLITYTGGDQQSSLKDRLGLTPIAINNCSEISIAKATTPAGIAGGPFNYTLDQVDGLWVHDDTLAETNGLGADTDASTTSITSNINAGDTHHWINVIAQPDYRLTENSLPSGWTLAQISCTFWDPFFVVNGVVTPQQRTTTATFQAATSGALSGFDIPPTLVDNGIKTSCTITNATSAVRIVKAGTGAPGQAFTFSATGQADAQLHIGDSVTYAYAPGTAFTVTEALPATTPAWDLFAIGCTDEQGLPGDISLNVAARTVSATTQAGHLLTCTFNNHQRAGLTVTKVATGVAAGFAWGPFDLTLSSSDGGTFTGAATQSISGTGPNEGTPVAGWADLIAGKTYTIAETPAAGWTSTLTCSGVTDTDGTVDGSVTFVATAGQVLACTATNAAAPGSVTLTKTVSGVDPSFAWGPFDFTISGDAFTGNATQSISGTGSGNGATTANWGGLVAGGTYTITETPAPGFVTVLSCTDVVDQDETADNSITFTATLGQQITCSATNRAIPASLLLEKQAAGLADGTPWGPFDFTLSGGTFSGTPTQSIAGTGNAAGSTTASWTALVPGATYTLTETPVGGWVPSIVCNVADTNEAPNVVTFVAPLGTEVSCHALNTAQPATVSVTKDVSGIAAGLAWSFDFTLNPTTGVPEAATQTIAGTGPATGAGPVSWSNLLAGTTYTISETPVAGWTSTLTCGELADADTETAGFQFQAQPGMALSCSATNAAQPASVTVVKDVTDVPAGSAWSFGFSLSPAATGASPQTISGTGPATGAGPATWTGLIPGTTYTISEAPAEGFAETITCTGVTDADAATAGFQFVAQPAQALTCTATNTSKPVDLALDKSDGGAFPMPGTSFDYTLTVTNAGTNNPVSTDPITVTDVLPAGLSFGSPLPAGCSAAAQTLTCSIAPSLLNVGAAPVVLTVPVTVDAGASGTVVNKAWVTTLLDEACAGAGCVPSCPNLVSSQGNVLGAVAANNTDCEDTPIQPPPPSTLPATGSNSAPWTNLATVLVGGGVLLLLIRRRLGRPAV